MTHPALRSRLGSRPALRTGLALLAFSLPSPLLLGAVPDLVATAVNGPNIVEAGNHQTINVTINNNGAPVGGPIQFEILLSTDFVVDANDVSCGVFNTNTLGGQYVNVFIPADTPSVLHNWVLKVTPDARETNTGNNFVFGIPVGILHIDLCLAGNAGPVEVQSFVNGPPPAPEVRYVGNCGTNNSILIYAATEVVDVPWLTVTPPNNFAIANSVPQPSILTFNTTGLALGNYAATVRFQSLTNPDDFAEVPVALQIVEPHFEPGDRIVGTIDSPGETDEALFDAVKGERVVLKVASPTGDVAPVIQLVDDQNVVRKTLKFKHNTKAKKKTLKIPESGAFRLRVAGVNATTGNYDILTARKLPKAAGPRKSTLKAKKGAVAAATTVLSLPGCLLDMSAKAGKKFTGPLGLGVEDPQGGTLNTQAFTTMGEDGSMNIASLPFQMVGGYMISVTGFGSKKDSAKLILNPTQPPPGTGVLQLP